MADPRIRVGPELDISKITFTKPWVPLTRCAELLGTTRGELYGKIYEFRICSTQEGKNDVLLNLPQLLRYLMQPGNRLGGSSEDILLVDGLLRLQSVDIE